MLFFPSRNFLCIFELLIKTPCSFLSLGVITTSKLPKTTALLHSLKRTDFKIPCQISTYRPTSTIKTSQAHSILPGRTRFAFEWKWISMLAEMWMQPQHYNTILIVKFIQWHGICSTFEWFSTWRTHSTLLNECKLNERHVHLQQMPLLSTDCSTSIPMSLSYFTQSD